MAEPHDSLLAFLSDLDDQAACFEAGSLKDPAGRSAPIVKRVINDLRVRLSAQAVIIRQDARKPKETPK